MANRPSQENLSDALRLKAEQLGLELFGITTPTPPQHIEVYESWLEQQRHGNMSYLATERARLMRANPLALAPSARSILVVGLRYPSPHLLPPPTAQHPQGRVASYAWGVDYHAIIPQQLEALIQELEYLLGQPLRARIYSDTGPILERDLAQRAGLGWIGKNTCLIHPRKGSYFLLGEAFIEAELPPSNAFNTDHCGSCRRCIEACPTQCILPDRTLDASRCISYLTIENKSEIPPSLRPAVGTWVFGCDICQMVCPWNLRFARPDPSPAFILQRELAFPNLIEEIRLSPPAFKAKYAQTPVARAKRRGFLRNVAVALGNAADPGTDRILGRVLREETEPLVRAHVAWALGRINTPHSRLALERAQASEPDVTVQREIQAALAQNDRESAL